MFCFGMRIFGSISEFQQLTKPKTRGRHGISFKFAHGPWRVFAHTTVGYQRWTKISYAPRAHARVPRVMDRSVCPHFQNADGC